MNPKIEEILKALEYEAFMWRGNGVSAVCLDAADLITKLQQELIDERYRHDRYADFCVAQGEELSKLKVQQRWIPVTEPPKEDEQVFAFCHEQVFVAYYHPRLGFISDETGHVLYDVTHWMPLPKAPKEDE